ncbi:MAG: C39 family peptidase [Planctomycetes bacterium]|nr:C39 family peptidase [Planctomycetota bacterium]
MVLVAAPWFCAVILAAAAVFEGDRIDPMASQSSQPASRRALRTPPVKGAYWVAFAPYELNTDGAQLSTSAVLCAEPFESIVVSFCGVLQEGAIAEVEVQLQTDSGWSAFVPMLKATGAAKGTRYESIRQAPGGGLQLEVDTLSVPNGKEAYGFQLRVRTKGTVELRALAATYYKKQAPALPVVSSSPAWGTVLDVPQRSQGIEDPALAHRICSPTSVAMVLEYLGVSLPTAEVARRCYDTASNLYGNWSVNAAAASEMLGGPVYAVRARSFAEIEAEILSGRPVVLSHSWKAGELSGAPLDGTAGHLIVVCGFTPEGDLVVNDPAFRSGQVRRTYKRSEIWKTWQQNASGIVYLFRPKES